jgi:hypothetical protein
MTKRPLTSKRGTWRKLPDRRIRPSSCCLAEVKRQIASNGSLPDSKPSRWHRSTQAGLWPGKPQGELSGLQVCPDKLPYRKQRRWEASAG